jgi:nucleoporin p58/p45
MSAAFAPFDPHNDAPPPAIPAAGTDSATSTVPTRSPDQPIRFPHIPSIDQTPPGMSHYLQRQNQALRVDSPHATLGQASVGQTPVGQNTIGQNTVGQNTVGQNTVGQNTVGQNTMGLSQLSPPSATSAPPKSPAVVGTMVSSPASSPQLAGQHFVAVAAPPFAAPPLPSAPHGTASQSAPPHLARVEAQQPARPATAADAARGQPIPVRPSSPSRDSWRSLSTQVEQIADYLRRRRNELETEQTDLKLNALMQEAALLQEREQLRGQQLNIQMVQATLEILRRQLLDFGNSLSESLPANHPLFQQLEAVCQAYYDAASVSRLLDVS